MAAQRWIQWSFFLSLLNRRHARTHARTHIDTPRVHRPGDVSTVAQSPTRVDYKSMCRVAGLMSKLRRSCSSCMADRRGIQWPFFLSLLKMVLTLERTHAPMHTHLPTKAVTFRLWRSHLPA